MILVRHSIPEKRSAIPPAEWQLSEEGRARCHVLADQLAQFKPGSVFTSPETKAFETAGILGQDLGLEVQVISELAEHDRTASPYFSSQTEFEQQVRQFFLQPDRRVFGRESAIEALERFQRGIARVKAGRPTRPLVVTHGTVMSLYIANQMQLDGWTIWNQLELPCYVLCP